MKNSIGNREAKELICMTHGHELNRERDCWWEKECRAERNKGGKNGIIVIA